MPLVNHLDLVRQVVPPLPLTPSPSDLLGFVLRVLATLPEHAGLLRKEAGEHIFWYAPAGVHVSLSHVCYPDGQIYEILTDVGVGGTNRPAWNDGGTDSDRWIPVPLPPTHLPLY